MSRPREAMQSAMVAAQAIGQGGDVRQVIGQAVGQIAGQVAGEKGFSLNTSDFMAARDQGVSLATAIEARSASLNEAGEIINRSFTGKGPNGEPVHVISPVVIPKDTTARIVLPLVGLAVLGLVGLVATGLPDGARVLFGPHYWVVLLLAAAFLWWQRSVVMVPDGCQALITRFGKLETDRAGRAG